MEELTKYIHQNLLYVVVNGTKMPTKAHDSCSEGIDVAM